MRNQCKRWKSFYYLTRLLITGNSQESFWLSWLHLFLEKDRIAFESISYFRLLRWLRPNYRICNSNLGPKRLLLHGCHGCAGTRLALTDAPCKSFSTRLCDWISSNYPELFNTVTWPKVQPAPLGLTLKPNLSSGSLHKRSQIAP